MAKPALAHTAAHNGDFATLATALAGRGSQQAASQLDSHQSSLFMAAVNSEYSMHSSASNEKPSPFITPAKALTNDKAAALCLPIIASYGGNPDTPDFLGRTPLHDAAMLGRTACVEALIGLGVNLEAATPDTGRRAIHFAAANTSYGSMVALAEAGADLSALDAEGLTALDLAAIELHHQGQHAWAKSSTPNTRREFYDALHALAERASLSSTTAHAQPGGPKPTL